MDFERMALVQGRAATRAHLRDWNRKPARILVPWTLWSFSVAIGLLIATWFIATHETPDPSGLASPHTFDDYLYIMTRNFLVLALHALACVAGFTAGSSLPVISEGKSGLWRKVHDVAGPASIMFVSAATLFSLGTQAYALGMGASTLAAQHHLTVAGLLVRYSIHAVPELTALFLPLAAWTLAARRGAWDELLAATAVTVGIAVPVLLMSGAIETWVTPHLL